MKLFKLADNNKKTKKLRSKQVLLESWKDIKQVLYYQGFPYVPKVICFELISRHHDNPLIGNFGIEKTWELIARKYYWLTLPQDVGAYLKSCDVCLASKAVCYKPYGDL